MNVCYHHREAIYQGATVEVRSDPDESFRTEGMTSYCETEKGEHFRFSYK